MDGLPNSVLFFTQAISNYTTNTIKLNTLNQATLKSDGATQLRLAMPVNSYAHMSSLSLHCQCNTFGKEATGTSGADNNAVYALIPRNGPHALIQRLAWNAGGIALDNSTTPYHVIYALLQNMKKGTQKYMSDDKVLQQSIIEPIDMSKVGNDGNGDPLQTQENLHQGQSKHFVVNNLLGWTQCQPSVFPLQIVPEMFLTLQITDKSVLPIQYQGTELGQRTPANTTVFNGTECEFELKDIYFTLEVCNFGNGMMDQLVQRVMMEQGSVSVPYPVWNTFTQEQTGPGGTIRGSVSCMSLDRVYYEIGRASCRERV